LPTILPHTAHRSLLAFEKAIQRSISKLSGHLSPMAFHRQPNTNKAAQERTLPTAATGRFFALPSCRIADIPIHRKNVRFRGDFKFGGEGALFSEINLRKLPPETALRISGARDEISEIANGGRPPPLLFVFRRALRSRRPAAAARRGDGTLARARKLAGWARGRPTFRGARIAVRR